MKTFFKWLAAVIAVVIVLVAGFIIIINSLLSSEVTVHDNSYLHMDISGSLPEYVAPDALEEALGQVTMDLRIIRENLEKAAVDERINGVALEIGFLQTGYAKIQELHHLITEFRKSGKKIYAFLGPELAFTKDYYVATACDSVFMAPTANLTLSGVRSEITFYKKFFDKLGIEAEFTQIGEYKNAPDVYTRPAMAPAHREVLQNIVDRFYEDLVTTISRDRDMPKNTVERLINTESGFTGKEAARKGLIDRCLYKSDLAAKFNINGRKPIKIKGSDYARVALSSLEIRTQSRIAVINLTGVISSGSDSEQPYFGKILGATTAVKNLRRAAASKLIKAIILRIDSPGGSATASDEIWQAIRSAAKKKPVIASVSDYGASGGYYIAMAADTIINAPNSLVGSIGIYAGKFNVAGLYDKLGLKHETVSRGENAGLFSLMQPWTRQEKAIIEKLIKDFYDQFLEKTARARNLSPEQVEPLARGRVWTGEEAVQNHLCDKNGYFYDAVQIAKERASVPTDESVRLVYYPREKSLLSQVLGSIHARIGWKNYGVESALFEVIPVLQKLQNRPLALLPYRLSWD